jgi:mono/diheme cytochrome c family protein
MKIIERLLRPVGIITLAFALLLAMDGAWALARKETQATPVEHDCNYDALAKVPEKECAKENPLESDPNAPAAGRKLYGRCCAECHGPSGQGGKRGPNLRATEVQQAAPGTIFWILSNGVLRKGMPDWSKLPEPERWQIVSYLKTLGNAPVKHAGSSHD